MLRSPPKLNCSSAMPRRWCAAPPCGCSRGLSRNGFPRWGGSGGGEERRRVGGGGGWVWAQHASLCGEGRPRPASAPPPEREGGEGGGGGGGGAHEAPLHAPP